MSDKRIHSRSPIRTLVTVLCNDADGRVTPSVFKAWTEDISASGMQFACNDELVADRLYVRILLPELEDKIVECEVVRRRQRERQGLLKNVGPRWVYGVRFERVRALHEFENCFHSPTPAVGSREPAVVG